MTQEQLNKQLFDAVSRDDIEAVKQAIEGGANVNAKDNYGWTSLHKAARWGHREVAKILIDNGAPINARDKDGWTPLHYAARWEHTETAELLKQHGGVK